MPRSLPGAENRRSYFQSLRSFCHAAQTGSISRAADLESLSQPAVSLQIQGLEKLFGVALFQRRGPKIRLTPDGQTLYDLAWPLVESMESLSERFKASRLGLETGLLNIAAGESTILYILPEFLNAFTQAYPGIRVKLHNVTGRDGLKLVRSGAVDFAVGSMIEVAEDISYHPTFSYDPMLITPIGHPLTRLPRVTIKHVAQYPLILPPQHLTTWRVVDFVFHKYGLNYRVGLEAGGWEVIKKYVSMGLGISIVTGLCLTPKDELVAIPFRKYFPRRTYGIVQLKSKLLAPPALRFIKLMRAHAAADRNGPPRRQKEDPQTPARSPAKGSLP
jgi:DNA-binding transcriptional LysR family regulator